MTSKSSYQDFVIKDGRLVGKFEEMYRQYDDPWYHELINRHRTSLALASHQLRVLRELNGAKHVLDIGCGKGQFTAEIAKLGLKVTAFDISATAIQKASTRVTSAKFEVGTLKDWDRIGSLRPDVIVMCQITWYVLEELESFLGFLKRELPDTILLHILQIYAPGEQSYGREYFSDLQSILAYFAKFGMCYLEYGEIKNAEGRGDTFFLGSWNKSTAQGWKRFIPDQELGK